MAGGCVRESLHEDGSEFRFDRLGACAVLVVSVAISAYGVARIRSPRRYVWLGWVLLAMGLALAVTLVPSLFMDRVLITDRGLNVRTLSWPPRQVEVQFADTEALEIFRSRRGGRQVLTAIHCQTRSGKKLRLPVSPLVELVLPQISDAVAAQGVAVRRFLD